MPSQAVAQSSPLGMMPTGVPHTSAVYTVKATAQLLSCSEWFVRQLFYKGRIKCNKLPSGDIRIPASAIDKFLNDTETTYRPRHRGHWSHCSRAGRRPVAGPRSHRGRFHLARRHARRSQPEYLSAPPRHVKGKAVPAMDGPKRLKGNYDCFDSTKAPPHLCVCEGREIFQTPAR